MALDNINELDTDSFMVMIKLVLCAVSKTSSNKDTERTHKYVLNHLEQYLTQMNSKIYQMSTFDVHNKQMLQIQVKVM